MWSVPAFSRILAGPLVLKRPQRRIAMLKEDLSLPETARLVTRATPLKDLKLDIGGFTLVRDTSAE